MIILRNDCFNIGLYGSFISKVFLFRSKVVKMADPVEKEAFALLLAHEIGECYFLSMSSIVR